MTFFWKSYGILCLILIPILTIIFFVTSSYQNVPIIGIEFLIYTCMSIVLFLILKRSTKSPKAQKFLYISIANSFIKILVTIVIVLIYKYFSSQYDKKFVIPFILVYAGFTIFETIFMSRLATYKPR